MAENGPGLGRSDPRGNPLRMCLALFGNGSRFQSNATHSPPRGCGASACRSLPNHAKQAPLLESAAPGRKCGLTRISHQDAEHYVEKCLSLSSCGALYGVFRVQTVLGAPWRGRGPQSGGSAQGGARSRAGGGQTPRPVSDYQWQGQRSLGSQTQPPKVSPGSPGRLNAGAAMLLNKEAL